MNYKPGPGYFKKCGDFDCEYIPLRCFVYKKKVEVIDLVSENESKSESESKNKSESESKSENENESENESESEIKIKIKSKDKHKDEPAKKKTKLIVQIEGGLIDKVCIEVIPNKYF
jgi:hypothetical protein